ncbi:MAG: hypothetical protein ABSH03_20515 [Candidatus Lustribacter sp.]
MKKLALGLCLIAALALGACSQQSAQSALEPSYSSCNPLNSTLQFYAGTANVAGTTGLNTLVTLRQNAGANCNAGASVLVNAPTITGPAGFTVPAATDAGGDAGTNKISGSIVTSILTPPAATTFDNSTTGYGLATSYGFMPSTQQNSLTGPSLLPYSLPFYVATAAKLAYIGGPPAFVPPNDSGGTHTSTRDGDFPGDPGYVLGFVDFQAPPVAGSYGLSVTIPTGQNLQSGASSYGTETAASSITHVAPLATWAVAPTFVSDGTGGGTITTNFAGGAGLTEEYIELVDTGPGTSASACTTSPLVVTYPIYYTFKVAPGTATVTVPDNIGPAQPGKAQGHTLCTAADNGGATGPGGDAVSVYGFAVDYSLFSSAFPQSAGNPAPTVTLNAGQADVTTSPANTASTE